MTFSRVRSAEERKAFVRASICPECGGALDAGWRCGRCGFNARPIADADARADALIRYPANAK